MKIIILLLSLFIFNACADKKTKSNKSTTKNLTSKTENLVEIKNGMYTEWYPGKKSIKFKGPQDNNKKRHGIWRFFSENGTELSSTIYIHGKKNGHTVVKYPNGTIHYTGEYLDDKPVGIWRIYDINGKLTAETDKGR
jgi:antitoxin component YwqK of YwqJK toxin-antitoxin module